MEQWGERSIWKQPKHCLAFETIISWIQEHTFERKIIQPYYYWSCRLCCGNGRYLPLPFEANPQLCLPKKSPKRTRNGNFAPNGVKNGPKRAAMVQKELKIDWKCLRIVFWEKKLPNCGGVWGRVCAKFCLWRNYLNIINSRTEEVGSTDSINQNYPIQIAGRNKNTPDALEFMLSFFYRLNQNNLHYI